ncbi:hypothetical protein LQV05_003750 [Cryptococcus neoformans]|nr:hypothetical protein LQV05_003750 [Cryptococcus neoformans]
MAADTPFIIDKELPGKPMQVAAVPPSEATTRKVMKFADIKGDNIEDDEEDQEEQEGQSKVHNKHQLALPEALNLGDELSDEDNEDIPVETPLDHSSDKDTLQSQSTNPQQRSKRDARVPSHLASDYILNQVTSAVGKNPKTAKEALVAADWIDWQRAMDEELKGQPIIGYDDISALPIIGHTPTGEIIYGALQSETSSQPGTGDFSQAPSIDLDGIPLGPTLCRHWVSH